MIQTHYLRNALGAVSGASATTLGWCEALSRAGEDVRLMVQTGRARLSPPSRIEVIEVPHLSLGRASLPLRLRERGLGGSDVAVVHAGWRPGQAWFARVCRRYGIPYIVTTHGVYIEAILDELDRWKRSWWTTVERPFLDGATAVHVYFEDEIAVLRRAGIEGPFVVAPCGIDLPPEPHRDPQDFFLWIGRYNVAQKGLDLLVEALAGLPPARRRRIVMRGVDDRGGRARLERLVGERGLGEWVSVDGPVYGKDKSDLLDRCAGFLYPSRWEAFGMGPAEAAGRGVPTLVTPYPLGKWLHTRGAAVMSRTDPVSIAAGMGELSERAEELGATARVAVRRELGWKPTAERWLEQVEDLLRD